MTLCLLHGTLQCIIYKAEDLVYDEDLFHAPRFVKHLLDDDLFAHVHAPRFVNHVHAPRFVKKVVKKIEHHVKSGKGPIRVYATIELGNTIVGRTRIATDDPANPEWNESFHIYCAHTVSQVTITVKRDGQTGAHVIGKARIPLAEILPEKPAENTYDLLIEGNSKQRGKLKVKLHFSTVQSEPSWGSGVLASNYNGVPFTFFPQRRGCKITLYQDAHMQPGFLHMNLLERGMPSEEARCWEDIYTAISNAKYFIYISGWSVHTSVRLVRDPYTGDGETLGELLKRKADEGCRVLLLVWDDPSSLRSNPDKEGVMHTRDEETLSYFKSTKVDCVLCPRSQELIFAHHQKTISLDAENASSSHYRRRIVSFLGGLDLCDGRYDDQNHRLFRTLSTVHKDDFHNGCLKGAALEYGGPRLPWHDIHAKIEGPAAWDVLTNFEQRWRKQGKEGHLLDIHQIGDLVPMDPETSSVTEDVDPETWNAQIFRSIDEGAAFGFPEKPEEAAKVGLIRGKGQYIFERSIHDAYIHAIRRAKNFIYIENQYFLGSCASWDSMQDVGCDNLVPIELALKIARKIEAGERFAVYIVIPMWPEGSPDSLVSTQPILQWQRKTMEMMYMQVCRALYAKGIYDVHPKEYLSFFCLGNRESKVDGEHKPVKELERDNSNREHYSKSQVNRRFMIYVHSKLMIVDDDYIIVGSANINQRSMDGGRDTEIAVGAYQPLHTSMDQTPRGRIHCFRMSLWYEHTGVLLDEFWDPSTIECMRKVNEISEKIWEEFIREEDSDHIRDLPAHLLPYPVQVRENGSVCERDGHKCFPNTKAKVLVSLSSLSALPKGARQLTT